MADEDNTRDDAGRLAARIEAAYEDAGFALDDGCIERARRDAITILTGDIVARDAALCDARAEIENLKSDAANDAGRIGAMKRGFDQLYGAIGIAPKGDHWSNYLFRVKTEIGFLREQNAAKDAVVAAAREIASSPKFPRSRHELLRERYALVEAIARLDTAPREEDDNVG